MTRRCSTFWKNYQSPHHPVLPDDTRQYAKESHQRLPIRNLEISTALSQDALTNKGSPAVVRITARVPHYDILSSHRDGACIIFGANRGWTPVDHVPTCPRGEPVVFALALTLAAAALPAVLGLELAEERQGREVQRGHGTRRVRLELFFWLFATWCASWLSRQSKAQ